MRARNLMGHQGRSRKCRPDGLPFSFDNLSMLSTHTAAERGFSRVWSVRVCFVDPLQKSLTLMTTHELFHS